jgi:hypothetical protein
MPICHHIKLIGLKVADCGSTSWSWVTTGWESVTCPACLERRPLQAAQQQGGQGACPVPHPQMDFEFICDLCGEHIPARR